MGCFLGFNVAGGEGLLLVVGGGGGDGGLGSVFIVVDAHVVVAGGDGAAAAEELGRRGAYAFVETVPEGYTAGVFDCLRCEGAGGAAARGGVIEGDVVWDGAVRTGCCWN